MDVIDALLSNLSGDAPVYDVRVCLHWTAVVGRRCGLAATLRSPWAPAHQSDAIRDVGRLHTKTARELAAYAASGHPTEASIGLAAINSLIQPDLSRAVDLNAADVIIQQGQGKTTTTIGHFPFTGKLRAAGLTVHVVELDPGPGDLPAGSAPDILPQSDIVVITSTTIINHTFDSLIKLCSPHALVMLVGPSTPLSPILFDYGVSMLAGAVVTNSEAVLRAISQGGTFQQVEGARLVTLTRSAHTRL
jgi:hypothetical protein